MFTVSPSDYSSFAFKRLSVAVQLHFNEQPFNAAQHHQHTPESFLYISQLESNNDDDDYDSQSVALSVLTPFCH